MAGLVVAGRDGQMVYGAGANEADLRVFCSNGLFPFDGLHTSSGVFELLLCTSRSTVLGLLRGSFSQTSTEAAPRWPSKVGRDIVVLASSTPATSPASATTSTSVRVAWL